MLRVGDQPGVGCHDSVYPFLRCCPVDAVQTNGDCLFLLFLVFASVEGERRTIRAEVMSSRASGLSNNLFKPGQTEKSPYVGARF